MKQNKSLRHLCQTRVIRLCVVFLIISFALLFWNFYDHTRSIRTAYRQSAMKLAVNQCEEQFYRVENMLQLLSDNPEIVSCIRSPLPVKDNQVFSNIVNQYSTNISILSKVSLVARDYQIFGSGIVNYQMLIAEPAFQNIRESGEPFLMIPDGSEEKERLDQIIGNKFLLPPGNESYYYLQWVDLGKGEGAVLIAFLKDKPFSDLLKDNLCVITNGHVEYDPGFSATQKQQISDWALDSYEEIQSDGIEMLKHRFTVFYAPEDILGQNSYEWFFGVLVLLAMVMTGFATTLTVPFYYSLRKPIAALKDAATHYENETSNESMLWSSLLGRKKNLRDAVSHAFLLCVLVPVIVFNIGAFALVSNVSEQLAHQQNENQSYQIQQALNDQIMDRVHFLIAMSYDDRMEVALNTNDAQAVAAVTTEYSKLNAAEDMIYVYGLSGEMFYSTDTRLSRVLQPGELEAYKAQAGTEAWQLEVYNNKDKQSVRILHWIRSTTDMRIIGVVQYEFSTLEFQNCWHGTDVRRVLLQDKNGAQIYTYFGEEPSNEDTLRTDTWRGKLKGINWDLEIISNLWGQELFLLQLLGQQLTVVLIVFLVALLDAGRLANHLINQLFRISVSGKQAYQKEILWYFPERFEIEEFSDLGHSFNLMAQRVENLVDQQIISVRKEEELRSQKQQMELFALQAQINPHFLYNTLECISCVVAAEEPKKAIHMISLLGNLFRYSASRQSALVPLAEELQQLKEYFYLMDVRLNGRLTLDIFITQELMQVQVLKLCLQPLLENVVIHAIRDSEMKCHVKLHGWRVREELILCMEDDGGGIPPEKLELLQEELLQTGGKNRIGLINVNTRLRLFCGDNYGIWLESQEGVGTKVYMKLPYRKTDN